MEVVLAIGAVQAVFFAFLIINKDNQRMPDKVLACWLLVLSVHLTINYLQLRGLYSTFPHLVGSTSSLVFLYGPLLFIYIDSSISEKPRFKREYLYHFIPFLLYNLLLIPFYIQSGMEKLHYSENLWRHGTEKLEGLLLILKALFGPFYIVWSLRLLNKHKRNIRELFSYHENIDLQWLRYLIWSMAAVLAIFITLIIAKVKFPQFALSNTELFIFLAVSVWILALGYYGIRQTPIFINAPPHNPPSPGEIQIKKKQSQTVVPSAYKARLEQLLVQEKPYLQSKLTLHDLATRLQLPAHQLSQLINREFGRNFFELINNYRVEEVKRKLADPSLQHLTLLGIALECGFNSKASFNRIFKKTTGQTPHEFQKQLAN